MKIKITEIFHIQNELHVKFCTSIGSATALWRGSTPQIGEALDVELDLDEVFSWEENIMSSTTEIPQITAMGNTTYIIAELIQPPNEECAALKIQDWIILIELEAPIPQKSGFVELLTNNIHAYPTNI